MGYCAIVLLYLLPRTVGVPLLGHEAGRVEGLGLAEVGAAASELGIAVALIALLLGSITSERRRVALLIVAAAPVTVGHVGQLLRAASRSWGRGLVASAPASRRPMRISEKTPQTTLA